MNRKQQNPYNVWTDGSYQESRRRGGVGWIIHPPGMDAVKKAAPLPALELPVIPHGSDYSELYAVSAAFNEIPSGADVRLHADCQNVLDWLKNGRMNSKPETKKALSEIFENALTQVQRMKSVEYIKASDKNKNGNMALAHTLSRQGALMPLPVNL